MAKGRPRKAGKRNKSGRLVSTAARDYGTDATMTRKAMFGENGCDAIGRAYVIGALGSGSLARDRLGFARALYGQYWAHIAQGGYRCALDQTPRGGNSASPTPEQHARQIERERRLNDQLADARSAGVAEYRAFSELVIDPMPDSGPAWLDRLCAGYFLSGLFGKVTLPEDMTALRRALRSMDCAMGVTALSIAA